MLATLLFMNVVLNQEKPLMCPINNEEIPENAPFKVFNGVKVMFCCAGCDTAFAKDPMANLAKSAKKGQTSAVFMFEPFTKKPIDPMASKFTADYNGIRYGFSTAANLNKFKASPATFAKMPKNEVLYCVVANEAVASYDAASGYMDYNGTRYYFCCAGCDTKFAKDPAAYVKNGKGHTKPTVWGK